MNTFLPQTRKKLYLSFYLVVHNSQFIEKYASGLLFKKLLHFSRSQDVSRQQSFRRICHPSNPPFSHSALKNSIRPKLFLAPHEPQKTATLFQGFSQKNIDSIDFKVLPLLKKKEVNNKKIRRGKRNRGGKRVERGFFKWKWKGTGGWKWAKVVLGNVPPFFYFPDLFLSNLLGGHIRKGPQKNQ